MGTVATEKALAGDPGEVVDAVCALAEDQWLERKSARIGARELANSLIGFANADGGLLVVGLDDGKPEEAKPKRQNEHAQANFDFCEPPVRVRRRFVECLDGAGEAVRLLVLEVQPDEFVHANKRDEVFLRVGDENRKLTFLQRQELEYDKGQSSYEARVVPGSNLQDREHDLILEYTEAVQANDAGRLLQARGLAMGDELTIAGMLLFGAMPQATFPEAFIRVIRYRGKERGTGSRQQILADERADGPIPFQIIGAQQMVATAQPVRRALLGNGKFGDVPLVPEDAWLEGIVNAAVHRSYSAAGDHIRVEIFDDRIEISSPGRFPGLVDLSNPLGAVRFARNPRIARVCADLSYGQELGEGIRRMFEEMRMAGLSDPIYRQTSGSVELTLLAEPVERKLAERLSDNARVIVSALHERERLSTGELESVLDVSRPVVQKELGVLREEGVVEWVGNSPQDPRAYWRLTPT